MKTKSWGAFLILAISISSFAQGLPSMSSSPSYTIKERGPHHRVWQWMETEGGPGGMPVQRAHSYTELATGLNYWDEKTGEWQESKEEIQLLPNGAGAVASSGQHKVVFPPSSAGIIELHTPDGKWLRSQVLGLAYFDTSTGTNVLIAELKESVGEVHSPNMVIYPDAFTDIKADLRYTYTLAGFEQDIVLHERPLGPEAWGLNPATTRLQVMTEFVDPPVPTARTDTLRTAHGETMSDKTLGFGSMTIGRGTAFSAERQEKAFPVGKEWLKLEGRDFLIEELPVNDLQDELQLLPQGASVKSKSGSIKRTAAIKRSLPNRKLAQTSTRREMKLASLSVPKEKGFVLDYVTVNTSLSNYTFQGGSTYYLSSAVSLNGTNTWFEGGTVLKYGSNVALSVNSPITWNAVSYRPVVMTAKDDNTAGEAISGSTGSPSGYYANPALQFSTSISNYISNIRVSYAKQVLTAGSSGIYMIYDGQFVNCEKGLKPQGSVYLRNVLFSKVRTNFNDIIYTGITVENATFDSSAYLLTPTAAYFALNITNSVAANVTNLASAYGGQLVGKNNGFYNTPVFGGNQTTNAFYPFQTVGAAQYYLTNGCAFRNVGVTNITATLLAGLGRKTTYPPIVYSNTVIAVSTTFNPQAQRDTDIPDLGYHYDPIDYAFGGVRAYSNLTFTAGTVAAGFQLPGSGGPGYGLYVTNGMECQVNGTVTSPCWMIRYNSVMEGGNGLWTDKGWLAFITGQQASYPALPARLTATFTRFCHLAGEPGHFRDYYAPLQVSLKHSEIYGTFGGYNLHGTYTNCLIDRCDFWQGTASSYPYAIFRNCTFHGGTFGITHWEGAAPYWYSSIRDCVFDGQTSVAVDDPYGANTAYGDYDYNAFLQGVTQLPNQGTHNQTVANFNWQTSWLGNFYLPSNSSLINTGSITANLATLYHFTTQTSQVKETNSVVDIGYHSAALNGSGTPIDTDNDGVPDCQEDLNGNGQLDGGETLWSLAINIQPQDQQVNVHGNVMFSVAASGSAPLTYQWQFNGTNLLQQTNRVLFRFNVAVTNAGNYSVTVSNGGGTITSSNAILTVCSPSFNTLSNLTVTAGSGAHVITLGGINDGCYSGGQIYFTAISSDTNLIQTPVIFYTNANSVGTLTLNSLGSATGEVEISVILHDNGNTNSINGEIGLGGGGTINAATMSTATAFNSLFSFATAVSNGTFGEITNQTAVIFNPFTFNPSPAASFGLWSCTNAQKVYSFDVWSLAILFQDSTFLNLFGTGIAHVTGLQDTPGTWTFSAGGFNNVVSIATDFAVGSVATVTNTFHVSVIPDTNALPSVVWTSPTNGQLFVFAPTNILLTATASNAVGAVQFLNGTNSLGYAALGTNNTCALPWTNVAAGSYSVSARATNNLGMATNAISINVNVMPTLSITSPSNLQAFLEITNVTITATAIDLDGSITNVAFYSGTNCITNDTTAPYSIIWSNLIADTYPITAVATDNHGASAVSTIRIFSVSPTNLPCIAITFPSNAMDFPEGAQITITATTSNTVNSTITNVAFYANGRWLGEDSEAPYSVTECCWKRGNYSLVAVAKDTRGTEALSDPVLIRVLSPNPANGGFWDFDFQIPEVSFYPLDWEYGGVQLLKTYGSNLFVGGYFGSLDGTMLFLTKWNTLNWFGYRLHDVVLDNVLSVGMQGTNLYAGGLSASQGDSEVIGRWNGTAWTAMAPTGGQDKVYAIEEIGSDLYAGGDFALDDGDPDAQNIVKLDRSTDKWVSVSTNLLNRPVYAIAGFGQHLFVGGAFTNAGLGSNVNYLAEFRGKDWIPLGSGIGCSNISAEDGVVRALTVCGANLFVGGRFDAAGGNTNANGIAMWNGYNWSTIGKGLDGGRDEWGNAIPAVVRSISARGNTIYVGGYFIGAKLEGTNILTAKGIAKATWNEEVQQWTWSDLDSGVVEGGVVNSTAILEGSTPDKYDLYVGGVFNQVGSLANVVDVQHFARWRVGYPQPTNTLSISLIAPQNNAVFTNPSSITLSANATESDPARIFAEVDFFVDGVAVGSVYSPDENGAYSFAWETTSSPPLVTGAHVLTATVLSTDSENVQRRKTSKAVTFTVTDSNPEVVAYNDSFTIFANAASTSLPVLENDLPTGLKVAQAKLGTIGGVNATVEISHDGSSILFRPVPYTFGTNYIWYAVTNSSSGGAEASATVIIRVPPVVQILSPDCSTCNYTSPVTSLTVSGSVLDWDGVVTNVTLFTNGVAFASTSPSGTNFSFNWSASAPGFYQLKVVAKDNDGYTNGSAGTTPEGSEILINVKASVAVSPPIAIINMPPTTNVVGGSGAVWIRDGQLPLSGSAYDTNGNPVSYQIRLLDPQHPEAPALYNVTPGTLNSQGFHAGAVTNAAFGTLDLSLVDNGSYLLELVVRAGGNEAATSILIGVDSQLKIGQFSFSEQDMVIPANGIPLTVTRTYNSLNPRAGDFGFSWTYALNDLDVVMDEERTVVTALDTLDNADLPPTAPFDFSLRTGGGRDVTLTLPDGRRTTFVFTLVPSAYNDPGSAGLYYDAKWIAPPGVTETLTTPNPTTSGSLGDNTLVTPFPPLKPFWRMSSGLTPVPMDAYDFPAFVLSGRDGTRYEISRDVPGSAQPPDYIYIDEAGYFGNAGQAYTIKPHSGKPKLTRITQRSGDSIEIRDDNISHYNATNDLTRSVLFERDAAGRITAIRDPNSGSNGLASVKYVYNRDTGNLIWVQRLVDRVAGIYTTTKYHYDHPKFPHYITSIEDPRGILLARNEYDDSGKLTAVIDADGKRTEFIHSISNRLEVVIDQLGYGSTNYYDLRGNVTATVNALGQTNRFTFDDNNHVLQSVDPLGHTNSFGYDSNGYRSATTNALGQFTFFGFDALGQLRSKTNALMKTISFDYDSAGHRTKAVNALGQTTAFGHDVYGRPNAVTNALNQLRATAGSDTKGDLQFVQQAGGLRMDFAHDLDGNTTNTSFVWVNPDDTSQTQNLATLTELDAANRVTRVTDPDGLVRKTIYDQSGRVAQSIDRFGNTNSYWYDARGDVIQTGYPDGTVTRNVYDARSQVLYSDDLHLPGATANGSHNVYDALGRLVRSERLANVQIDIIQDSVAPRSVLTSAGAVLAASSAAFDAAGRVQYSTNALGRVTQYEYDAAGRQTALIDALTNRTDSVYDAAGQLRFATNALGRVTEYRYDAKGRRIKTIFQDNSYTTNSYNEIGQLLQTKDQAGLATDYEYDNLGRLKAVIKPQVFDPEGGTNARPRYEYEYDGYGNIKVIRDSKRRETKFTYDALGQPISRKLPLLQTNWQTFNALGQLATAMDYKGQSNRFVYDSLGRVATNFLYATGASTPGQTNVFIYDANGRLYRIIRPDGTTSFAYNLDGAATNIVSPEGWISYEYDSVMGWLKRVSTTNSDVRYDYDELSRLKTVTVTKRDGVTLTTAEVTTNTYTKLGSLQDMFYPNGIHAVYQYNALNQLTNLTYTTSSGLLLAQYGSVPNANGWRQTAAEVLRQSNGTYATNLLAWGYDNLGRLTNEVCGSTLAVLNYTNRYVYDLAGNRLWKTNVSGATPAVTACTYNANDQLLVETTGASSFTNWYDANGSVTNRSSATETNWYSYNLEGKLANATVRRTEGGNAVVQTNRYFYNQSGIRTRMEMAGSVNQTNIFLNDPQNLTGFSQVLEELPAVAAAPRVTYTIGNRVLSQKKSGTVSHLLPDGHGSTRLLTDSTGAISDRYNYDACGLALDFSPGLLTPPRTAILYSGEQFDAGLQQYYLRARYYNPTVGRFGAMDAMDGSPNDPLSLHKYAYTQNNPVNLHDPSGNESLAEIAVVETITSKLQTEYGKALAKNAYIAAKKVTELGQSRDSLLDAAARNASPGADTGTIIVHGVSHKYPGWTQTPDETGTSFQEKLTLPFDDTRLHGIANDPLNHDFYEFNWGGFSIGGVGAIPIKSVHQMALVHLQITEFLVWMNGYANIDIISHSWGTTLTYDLQQTSDIETRNWVTMGSPLKTSTGKPIKNTGKWINLYDLNDKVVHLEMFPPFPSTGGLPLPESLTGPGLTKNPNVDIQLEYDFRKELRHAGWVHSDYWIAPRATTDLRQWLQ